MLATLIVWGHPSGTPAAQNSPYTPAAGSLPRRLSEAQAYATFTSGASCEGNGAGSITTLADCSAAAAALGLSDTTAEDDGRDGSSWSPPYCYFESDGDGDSLQFNSAGTNTGGCNSWDTCICWANAPPPRPPSSPPSPPPPFCAECSVAIERLKSREVAPGLQAQEWLSGLSGKHNPWSFLNLRASVDAPAGVSDSELAYAWSVSPRGEWSVYDDFTTGWSSANLVIRPNVMNPGVTYTFTVTVSVPTGPWVSHMHARPTEQAAASTTIRTNTRPLGGCCEVSPAEAYATITEVTIRTDGWNDEDMPLKYSFEVAPVNMAPMSLSTTSQLSRVETFTPHVPGTWTVICKAYDTLDAFSTSTAYLEVKEEVTTLVPGDGPGDDPPPPGDDFFPL